MLGVREGEWAMIVMCEGGGWAMVVMCGEVVRAMIVMCEGGWFAHDFHVLGRVVEP